MLSIIIPTFNRSELLEYGLSSLDRQIISFPYQILVLDEYVGGKGCEEICSKHKNVKYILTRPEEKEETIKWRGPGYAINFGVKFVESPVIILACPEMYLLNNNIVQLMVEPLLKDSKLMTYTDGLDDRFSRTLRLLRNEGLLSGSEVIEKKLLPRLLNTQYPFFLGMSRDEFVSIGGYDEDFQEGYCWDDNDFVSRMLANGCKYLKVPGMVIHLYHPRVRQNLLNKKELWDKNEALYKERQGKIVRNEGKEWGALNGLVLK